MADILLHPAMTAIQAATWCESRRAHVAFVNVRGQRGQLIPRGEVVLPSTRELAPVLDQVVRPRP